MSKSATATAPKNPTSQPPTKPSAWARGPPSSTPSSVTPRSQSPSSANATQPSTPTHSRKPSALGGPAVSVPRSIQPTQKPAAGLSFGSIAEPPAPLSSSPASVPPLSSDAANVKSFGSIPATNGVSTKPTISKPPSKPGTPVASSPSPTPGAKPKLDVKSLFRNSAAPPSAPSPTASSAPEGSPAQRPVAVPPTQQPQNGYYPSRPGGPPALGAGVSSNSTGPRSPQFHRQMSNGTSTTRNGQPNSPRMGGVQIQHPQQHQMPPHGVAHPQHMQPQHAGVPMQQWGSPVFYQYPVHEPGGYMQPFWAPNVGHPSMHAPPQAPQPPHTPGPHTVASPSRPPPPVLQGAPPPPGPTSTSTPAPSSSYTHSQSYSFPQSPPPPSTPQTPVRLNTQAAPFVAKRSAAIKIRNPESGEMVDLYAVASPVAAPSDGSTPRTTGSLVGHQRKPTEVRIESETTRNERLEAQRAKEQEKNEQELVAKRHREMEERIRKRKEEEERKRKEEEEKERKERERREELEREEKERIRKEEEEKEKARIRKEEEEKEKERIRKEEEERERLRLEEEEKRRKEEEEAAAKELARKAEEEARARAEEEERLKKEAEDEKITELTGSPAPSLVTPAALSRSVSPLPAEQPKLKRPIPGPLDLSATSKPGLPPSLPSALATARIIDNLDRIQYPEGIMSPKPELNTGASNGRFRYDRDFLLQFMSICKDKPDSLPALDAIGLEAAGDTGSMGRRNSRTTMPPPSGPVTRTNVALGSVFPNKTTNIGGFNQMGQFGAPTGPKGTSEERFAASQPLGRSVSASGAPGGLAFPNRGIPMSRTISQGGSTPAQSSSLNPTSGRTRSQRGNKRGEKATVNQMSERDRTNSMVGPNNGLFEPVEPLKASENRWTPMNVGRRQAPVDIDSPEVVERKVKSLLNKLTMEKFDSISDQIISWANKSEKEKDGRTLIQVIRLVFEKATDEAAWSEMYARLCRKMMEQISQNVQDDGIRTSEGKPIAGGQLFRKYLLNRCQEDFERGWSVKEASAKAAESKAADDKAAKDAAEKAEAAGKGTGEEVLYSDEYYAAQKAKRRGLGLVKFIGELFKLQMLTERIMHECIKKQLSNVENPEEEEIESLCKLLSTVGRQLDTDKARSHMDVYFQRMKELSKSTNITSRMQYMLLDVLELRDRQWVSRKEQSAPTTIAAVHEQAAKDHAKAQIDKDQSVRNLNRDAMSRGGSRRGEHRGQYTGQQTGPDGWTAVAPPRPTPTAGDLTQFGKISKAASGTMTFGPGSVFAAKKDTKGREGSLSRTNSTSNMFAMLNSEAAAEPPLPGKSSRPPSRKPSADFTQTGLSEIAPQRKKLALLPRTKPVPADTKVEEESAAPSEASDDEDEPTLNADQAKAKIEEDLKEFWSIRNLEEADSYLPTLPTVFRGLFIEKLLGNTIERKETDAIFVAEFLTRVNKNGTCSEASMEESFAPLVESLEDIAIDAPSAFKIMAILLKASKLPREKVEALAKTIAVEGEPLTHPSEKLLKEYEKLESS